VIAAKPGELAKLRDERLVDLADDLVRAGHVDTFVTTNGGMHVMLLTVVLQGRTLERTNCGGQAKRSQSERNEQSFGGFNSQSQRAACSIAAILPHRRVARGPAGPLASPVLWDCVLAR